LRTPNVEFEMAKGDGKKLPNSTKVGDLEVGNKTTIDASLTVTGQLSVIDGGELIIRGPMTPPRPRGRPPAEGTSMELFRERRKKGVALAKTKMAEAAAICAVWPPGQPTPKTKTVAQHIAKAFDAAAKSPRSSR
jgi:hypothetical protein